MELKSTRRIVTGHDAQGKAVALFDAPLQANQRSAGGNGMTLMLGDRANFPSTWPARRTAPRRKVGVPPPANGTIFRIVDFAPTPTGGYGAVDHHQILLNMGIDPATQGYARHENTHRTRTIDYAIVLEGEIDMLLDDTEVHVKAGDVLVQQGTNHAWVNNSRQAVPHRLHPDRRQDAAGVEAGLEEDSRIGLLRRHLVPVQQRYDARPLARERDQRVVLRHRDPVCGR